MNFRQRRGAVGKRGTKDSVAEMPGRDTLGWKGTSGGISTQTVTERVLANLEPGEIVLMHVGSNPDDGSTLDAGALPDMIDRISAAGYRLVTLDVLLGG